MTAAAERTEYERAAVLRDKIRAIERTMESQKMAAFARTELDLVGLARQDNQAAVQLFVVRDGKLVGRDVFLLDAARDAPDDEVLSGLPRAVLQPGDRRSRPESSCPRLPGHDETAALEAFLAERRGGPVHLRVPQRGEKRELMALAVRNATETLAREQARWLADQGKTLGALEELAAALGLADPPMRIECYDISNFQGRAVGREHGRLRGRQAPDGRVPPVPDQDGRGRRTTSPATRRSSAAGSAGRRPATRGAKRSSAGGCPTSSSSTAARARSARPPRSSPSSGSTTCRWPVWPRSARSSSCPAARTRSCCRPRRQALYLVQRLRDEAHRFAITYHRDLRAKASVRSAFDDLPGVGPKRRRALLRVFGSVEAGPRGAGRADRRGPRDRAGPGRADQGDARGLSDRRSAAPMTRGGGRPSRAMTGISAAMRRLVPILIVVIGLAALVIDFWPGLKLPTIGDPNAGAKTLETKLGLDLQGGLRVEYQALPVDGRSPGRRRR